MEQYAHLKPLFLLRPDITYLNFGSFGACPAPIFKNYQDWQLLLESEPCQFIAANATEYLAHSREALAGFVNCPADDVVYVTNPTYAINIVARSLPLNEGDEILTTNLEYGAMDRTWNFYCRQKGAKYVQQRIELPVTSKEEICAQFWSGLTPNTKAIFISHITSSTALILPVKEICAKAKELGLITIVDGAHVPGHIPLDLSELKADIYTGACHKWLMTPKGCSFLYVRHDMQHLFDPIIISWGYESAAPSHSQFLDYHQMQGTRDFSAFLTVKKALEFREEHRWNEVGETCHKVVRSNYQRFCDLFGTGPVCPVTNEFLGQMCSIPVPTKEPEQLQRLLFQHYKIEVPVMRLEDRVFLRYSVQGFNSLQDLDVLFAALTDIMNSTSLIEK